MKKLKKIGKNGFSLIEIIVVLGILSIFTILVADFQTKVFSFNKIFQGGIYSQTDSDNVIKSMAAELRSMSPSSAGAYPIDLASTSTLSFYNDIDDDGLKEKIRYYLAGTTLKRGVTRPSGNPITYNPLNENGTTLISNVRNSSSIPIFTYYNTNYNGNATTSLSLPINIIDVRLVNINVIVDSDPTRPLAPISSITQVSLRNIKDNI